MDLLNKINNCRVEELDTVINDALNDINKTMQKGKRLGFQDGASTSKIKPHKGFISLDSTIKYSSGSMVYYSMSTTDYFYEFARFIKSNNINTKWDLIKNIENFINQYFGISDGIDRRDAYFDNILNDTETDEEYFEKIESFKIGDLKNKNIAMCSERAAVAQNLLSLFGIEVYYCFGLVDNNGDKETHVFNIARAKNTFRLLDYSLPVSMFSNNRLVDYAPFQGEIQLNELQDVLLNGVSKKFSSYDYIKTQQEYKKVPNGQKRTYIVGDIVYEKMNLKISNI